jgi:endonuclease/exonuclease/phosphatase family metal-dependent hydrolase
MRIISLNVAQLVGKSGFIPLARLAAPRVAPRLAALLAAEAPDALALQEAPAPRAGFDPVASLLDGSLVRPPGRAHGPALLSRAAPRRARAELFRAGSYDGKGFALAELPTATGALLLVSVHLAVLRRSARRRQIDLLAAALSTYRAPLLVVGDLNDGGDAPLYLAERLRLIPYDPGPSYPAAAPALRLDWALASPALRVRRVDALRHLPSDHCAVRVDLDLSPRGPR